jgi:tetratricopeptide (TPR) repeat protein
VPEVSANMGFIHLSAKNYEAAQRDFERALTIDPRQVNAYWGFAMAMEAQGDLELALGAMRTYAHLDKEDSPFQRKAYAAIWEWEEQLRVKRGGEPTPIPPGAVGADDKKPVTTHEDLRKDVAPEAKP